MRKLIVAMLLFLVVSSGFCQSMTVPDGCVPADGAKSGYGGYADKITHQKTGITLVLIAPGTFRMGALVPGANSDVYPEHAVTIAYPFYIGRTEVTNSQFKPFFQTGYDGGKDVDPAYDLYARHLRGKSIMPTGNDYPMVYVSWKNAKAFCEWAKGLDLPSESEWEYACRAGTITRFYFGDTNDQIDKNGWTTRNSKGEFHPVAQLEPNPWGLYDMCGNVWEWTLDDYIYRYDNAPADGASRKEGKLTKSLRGGGWGNGGSEYVLSSYARFNSAPTNASNDVGFRVVLRMK